MATSAWHSFVEKVAECAAPDSITTSNYSISHSNILDSSLSYNQSLHAQISECQPVYQ